MSLTAILDGVLGGQIQHGDYVAISIIIIDAIIIVNDRKGVFAFRPQPYYGCKGLV